MSIQFEKIILDNKPFIIGKCSELIKGIFNRHYSIEKCQRDMSFVISAIVQGVYDNSPAEINRVIYSFYRTGELQLKTIEPEIRVYNYLKILIKELLDQNNLTDTYYSTVSNLIDILIHKLREGPTTSLDFLNRRNYKTYDTNISVPLDLETHLDLVLENTPMQEPHNKFCILKLKNTPKDIELKEFYLKNLFKNDKQQHMTAMATAPLVYMVLYNEKTPLSAKAMSAGIHGGALMTEVLRHGWDFSFIGCTVENTTTKYIKRSKRLLHQRFNFDFSKYNHQPSLCFCIGRGVVENSTPGFFNFYTTETGEKLKYAGLKDRNIVKKPNIIIS